MKLFSDPQVMRAFKVFLGLALFILIIVAMGQMGEQAQAVKGTESPAVEMPPTPERPSALYLCKDWTEKHSKLGVGEVIDQYNLKPKPQRTASKLKRSPSNTARKAAGF